MNCYCPPMESPEHNSPPPWTKSEDSPEMGKKARGNILDRGVVGVPINNYRGGSKKKGQARNVRETCQTKHLRGS